MNFTADNETLCVVSLTIDDAHKLASYITDSFQKGIFAYDYDLERGAISRERKLITFEEHLGVPDGSHIDGWGFLYVAMAFGESNVLIVDCGDRSAGAGRVVGCVKVDAMLTVRTSLRVFQA
jgi:sugar lactone lactonase YvrE